MHESAGANRRAAVEALGSALAFATMSAVAYGLRDTISWSAVAFSRIGVTMMMSWALVAYAGAPVIVRGTRALWWRSGAGSVGILCTFYSVTHMPVTDAVAIMAMSPLWVSLILRIFFRRALPRGLWLQLGLALAGVFLMKRPSLDAEFLPLAVALAGSVIIAVAKVSLSRCGHLPSYSVVAHYATCATLMTGVVSWAAVDTLLLDPGMSPWTWLWLLPMGGAGTLGQVLMTRAYGRGHPTLVALVGISQIAMASCYDALIFGHTFGMIKLSGIALIASAIAWCILATTRHSQREAARMRRTQPELGDG